MLSTSELTNGLTRLTNYFGKRFTEGMATEWEHTFQHCDTYSFNQSVDVVIKDCRSFPTISEFLSQVGKFKQRNPVKQEDKGCEKCRHIGYTFEFADDGYEYAHKCECSV